MIPILATVKADAFVPGAMDAYLEVKKRGVAHRWVLAEHSSQAFALNLFAPLDGEARRGVFKLLGLDVSEVDTARFEWSDEADRLGEMGDRGRHRTQVDVVLRGRSPDGQRIVALIEVKLTEGDFGWCSAYENPANPDRPVCRHEGLFGGQPESCFQLNNHGHGHRRYLEYLTAAGVVADPLAPTGPAGGGCALRRSANQPMRNLALGAVLLAEGEADRVVYAVCAPRQHPTIWHRFGEVRAFFADSETLTVRSLPAELVAALASDRGRALAARYGGGALDVAELANRWGHRGAFGGGLHVQVMIKWAILNGNWTIRAVLYRVAGGPPQVHPGWGHPPGYGISDSPANEWADLLGRERRQRHHLGAPSLRGRDRRRRTRGGLR